MTNKENSYVEVNVWISAKNAYLGRVKGWKFLLSGKQKYVILGLLLLLVVEEEWSPTS